MGLRRIWYENEGEELISELTSYLEQNTNQRFMENVTRAVKKYVNAVTSSMEANNRDRRLRSMSIHWVGSSFDGTKIPPPDEFDLLIHLPNVSGITPGIKYSFENLVRSIVETKGSFGTNISNPRVEREINTGVNLKLTYESGGYRQEVSVDLTPCVTCCCQPPTSIPNWVYVSDPVHYDVCFFIAHGGEVRPTFPTLEKDAMLSAGPDAQRCMKILKLLCMAVGPSPEKTFGMPYMLKQCLFYRFNKFKRKDRSWDSRTDHWHCRMVIADLKNRIENDSLYYFFDRSRKVDVAHYGVSEICRRLDLMLEKLR